MSAMPETEKPEDAAPSAENPTEEKAAEEGAGSGSPEGPAAAAGKSPADYEAELQELKDKHLRLYAEFDNFRRRSAKENFEVMATANAKILNRLTEVLDNFHLAFDPKHKSEKLEDFEKGIRLIYNRFREILEDEGLEEIHPVGEEFNPNVHEALMQQPSDTVADGHVIQVLQKGYKVKQKILKHAKVIVSTGKAE